MLTQHTMVDSDDANGNLATAASPYYDYYNSLEAGDVTLLKPIPISRPGRASPWAGSREQRFPTPPTMSFNAVVHGACR